MDWRHRAACLTEDPELFFPVGNTGPALQQIEDAKKICQSCAVKDQCLNWALDAGQDHGVWGGMSEEERSQMGMLGREAVLNKYTYENIASEFEKAFEQKRCM